MVLHAVRCGGTKGQVRQSAGEKLAFAQQLSGRVHVGTWAGGNKSLNLRISPGKEIMARCAVSGLSPRTPFVTPVLPGPGSDIRMKMGQGWFFQNAGGWLGSGVWPMFMGAVDWVRKGSNHTARAVPCDSSCTCSYAYGRGPLSGHTLESGAGHCLPECGGLSHP